jgi:hypothetical protein
MTTDTGSGTPPIVDMGAYEYDGSTPPQGPGVYVGPSGGSWFVASHWGGNVVPDATTSVQISTTVLLDQPGAEAANITVQAGGHLQVFSGALTFGPNCSVRAGGTLTVNGIGSVAGDNFILESGGVLVIDDAAANIEVISMTIQSRSTLSWNDGTVTIQGGTFASGLALSIGCSGQAKLIMVGAATLVSPVVTVCVDGRLECSGTIQAPVFNNGEISPGASAGQLLINGTYTQSASGTLQIELDGYLPGSQFDQVVVTGLVTLDGALEVALLANFTPELAGDQRLIVTPNLSGTFSTTNLPTLPAAFIFNIVYGVTTPDLRATSVQLLTTLSTTTPRLYVDANAIAGGDGQSWVSATPSLAAALELAALFPATVNEVWVAEGTYKPDRGSGDRNKPFQIGAGLSVYGGFAGGETDLSERDFVRNLTTLSGDLAGDDGSLGTFANNAENSYTVVRTVCSLCPLSIRLDGFTVTGGNSNQPTGQGGGILAGADNGIVANCQVVGNHATQRGGGMLASGFNTTVDSCAFVSNRCPSGASGLNVGGGTPQILDCLFDSNVDGVASAAEVVATSAATFERCTFTNNSGQYTLQILGNTFFEVHLIDCIFVDNPSTHASLRLDSGAVVVIDHCSFEGNVGTGVSNGGVATITNSDFVGNLGRGLGSTRGSGGVNLVVHDCEFINNSETVGGDGAGAFISSGGAEFSDCTFLGNQASEAGGGLYVRAASATLNSCVFIGNIAPAGSGIYNWTLGNLTGNATL